MTLLITAIAAIFSTVIWHIKDSKGKYRLGTLSLIYWGASLMWLVDIVFEYAELKSDFFTQKIANILDDSLLGIAVVALGLAVWIILLLIQSPKGTFKKIFTKNNSNSNLQNK